MSKRTKVVLAKWKRGSDPRIWAAPLGLPEPHDWVPPAIDDRLDQPDTDRQDLGTIPKGMALDSVGEVDEGGRVVCKLGDMTFTTAAAAIEEF